MQIKIETPKIIENERIQLINKIIDLLKKQARSNERYAKRISLLRYKLRELERKLGEN